MINQNVDKPRSESVVVGAPLDPGAGSVSSDMIEGLPVAVSDRRQKPKPDVEVAPVSGQAGPLLTQEKTTEVADIDVEKIGPVLKEKGQPELLRSTTQGPLVIKPMSEKEMVVSHLKDLVDDLLRISQGPPNILRRILGKQTIAADLSRLFQETGHTFDTCLGMVAIEEESFKTVVKLTLPVCKMSNRIQLKLVSFGFKSTKLDKSLVLQSPLQETI